MRYLMELNLAVLNGNEPREDLLLGKLLALLKFAEKLAEVVQKIWLLEAAHNPLGL